MLKIKPSFFSKIFSPFPHNNYSCVLNDYQIEYSAVTQDSQYSFLAIKNINVHKGLVWSRVHIDFKDNQSFQLTGLNNNMAKELVLFAEKKKDYINKIIKQIEEHGEQIKIDGNWVARAKEGLFWVSEFDKNETLKSIGSYRNILELSFTKIPLAKATIKSLLLIEGFNNNPEGFKEGCNNVFIPEELARYKVFFDKIESNPLTEEQRKAIISDEDSTLVIASAGSGKTSLLVGKVNYLIEKGFATEDQILVLAFNNNAKEEIATRLKEIKIVCETHTFHSFGLKVSAKAHKKKSSLASFIESNQLYYRFIQNKIEELIKDSKQFSEIKKFFISYFIPYQDKFNFDSLGEYYKFIKSNNLITLKGEYVKSMEELEISNFLFTNGIEYNYEKKYEQKTSTSEKRQYKPDFYLPENKIYIEHLALNRDNQTPPFIDQDEYVSGVDWKRELHKKYNTVLIETFSYQKREGNLTQVLEDKLRLAGVVFKPMDQEKFLLNLNEQGYISEFAKICGPFLNLFKGKNESIDALRNRFNEDNAQDNKRILLFLDLFQELFQLYEEELKRLNEIDFHDMINEANEVILNTNCYTNFKYILVDEFQDISFGRAKLITNLQKNYPRIKLLSVGDDWQSIYRFTGADIDLMTNFKKYFGYTNQLFLTKTFRFNSSIEKVASQFIRKNSKQIDKEIKAHNISNSPNVKLFYPNKKSGKFLENIVREISLNCSKHSKVLFLGRNNHNEEGVDYRALKAIAPKLIFEFRTVHRAKGYEADYVVILDLKRARNGFPNEMVDDPIINIMLSENEAYNHAEERRLFYVALTRAKHLVYVIAHPSSPSSFFSELSKDNDYFVEKMNVFSHYKRVCPLCKTSPLTEKTSKDGRNFFGCQNWDLCLYTSAPCQLCNIGYLEKHDTYFSCDNKHCKHQAESCPKCGDGYLHQKPGEFGLFLACSNYYTNNCDFTKNLS
ncbi:helicase IV [Methylophilales bacterium HTCC2181]|uniref:DNA 3'-5' helicase n=1 Tax=Methylophilales bacterium HTCC2181 TaxID=383631 RepID=A0P7H3_9PROT|nr:helicase IV [Methylophilales bacterium HTCC2181]